MASTNESVFSGTPLSLIFEWFGETVTYTTAEGTASTPKVYIRPFEGAIDNRENGKLVVNKTDLTPAEGDYFVRSGESDRWYIFDVREVFANYYTCRIYKTKERS